MKPDQANIDADIRISTHRIVASILRASPCSTSQIHQELQSPFPPCAWLITVGVASRSSWWETERMYYHSRSGPPRMWPPYKEGTWLGSHLGGTGQHPLVGEW